MPKQEAINVKFIESPDLIVDKELITELVKEILNGKKLCPITITKIDRFDSIYSLTQPITHFVIKK